MSAPPQAWYALSAPGESTLHCAACRVDIDLQAPAADHHPRVCPSCRVGCAFLNWKGRTVQIVVDNAPRPLAEAIAWAQEHLDELEYVELVCALEEIVDAEGAGAAVALNRDG